MSDTEPENPADGLLWYDPECDTTTTTIEETTTTTVEEVEETTTTTTTTTEVEDTTTTTTTCQLPEGLYNLGPIFFDYITFAEPVGTIYPRTIEEVCYCNNNFDEAIETSWISCLSDVEEPTIGNYIYDAANNCLLPSGYYMNDGVFLVIDGELISSDFDNLLCSTTTTTTIQE